MCKHKHFSTKFFTISFQPALEMWRCYNGDQENKISCEENFKNMVTFHELKSGEEKDKDVKQILKK